MPNLCAYQLPRESWHEWIGDETLADAILDRLVHNADNFELKGPTPHLTQSRWRSAGIRILSREPSTWLQNKKPAGPTIFMSGPGGDSRSCAAHAATALLLTAASALSAVASRRLRCALAALLLLGLTFVVRLAALLLLLLVLLLALRALTIRVLCTFIRDRLLALGIDLELLAVLVHVLVGIGHDVSSVLASKCRVMSPVEQWIYQLDDTAPVPIGRAMIVS